jgi:radical SAM superfamily enzyme YgiQ (UPF0313 family)
LDPLKIYLLDLTYTTITLSTEAFPLNVGYIAAYTKELFGPNVEITLFKYIHDVERELKKSPPDILGASNYCWNHGIGREISNIFSKLNPNGIVVWGGPNFPVDLPSQEKFFRENPNVDVYVSVEGEIGFTNVVEKALEAKSHKEIRAKVLSKPIDGCITRSTNGKLQYTIPEIRIKKLDEIPSPYLTGLMDKFFDGKLCPTIQTNRGCPFHCTFCTDGRGSVDRVNNFSLDRVAAEIDYIATHVTWNKAQLLISDLNFGMFPKDTEICDYINESKKKYGYPKLVHTTTGKNKKERIISNIEKLRGSIKMDMAVQSTTPEVLKNVRRDNISTEHLIAIGPAIKKTGMTLSSDIIVGLPSETFESTLQTVKDIIHADVDEVHLWTLMMLDGSELNVPMEREKWNIKTKYRVIPRDFVKLSNGKVVLEIEEVGISTSTLSFKEYVNLRLLALVVKVTKTGLVFDPILKFLQEQNLDVFDLVYNMAYRSNHASENITKLFSTFHKSTIDELWDSPEDIEKNYQNDNEYKKLLDGVEGQNLLLYYHTIILTRYISDWTEYILDTVKNLIMEKKKIFDDELKEQFVAISNYCRGVGHNVLGKDRMQTNPEFDYNYDIVNWLKKDTTLNNFKLKKDTKAVFKLTDKQFEHIGQLIKIYGYTDSGLCKVCNYTYNTELWRKPVLSEEMIVGTKKETAPEYTNFTARPNNSL